MFDTNIGANIFFPIRIKLGSMRKQNRFALPILKTSAKSVQTTRVVCTNFSRSLYRLQLKSPESTTYLLI